MRNDRAKTKAKINDHRRRQRLFDNDTLTVTVAGDTQSTILNESKALRNPEKTIQISSKLKLYFRFSTTTVQRSSANGGFAMKQQPQQRKQQQTHAKVISKQQKPQTLDSLFANMKEQRMKVMHPQNVNGRRNGPPPGQQNGSNGRRNNGPGQQRPRPPWGRYND